MAELPDMTANIRVKFEFDDLTEEMLDQLAEHLMPRIRRLMLRAASRNDIGAALD